MFVQLSHCPESSHDDFKSRFCHLDPQLRINLIGSIKHHILKLLLDILLSFLYLPLNEELLVNGIQRYRIVISLLFLFIIFGPSEGFMVGYRLSSDQL